jgi:hypothetical protein
MRLSRLASIAGKGGLSGIFQHIVPTKLCEEFFLGWLRNLPKFTQHPNRRHHVLPQVAQGVSLSGEQIERPPS